MANFGHRPQSRGSLAGLAHSGHLLLYALMVIVPTLGLFGQYGSGKDFSPFGVLLFTGARQHIDWMISLGKVVHSYSGWILLALIAGHVFMVALHQVVLRDEVLSRMLGNRERQ